MSETAVKPWEPGMPHAKPDPNVCPACGEHDTIRENGKRFTWQSVKLAYDEDGQLYGREYDRYEASDDVVDVGFECGECFTEWRDLYDLALEQRRIKALEDHAFYLECRVEDDHDRRLMAAKAFRTAIEIIRGNGEA